MLPQRLRLALLCATLAWLAPLSEVRAQCLNVNKSCETTIAWTAGSASLMSVATVGGRKGLRSINTWIETPFAADVTGSYVVKFSIYGPAATDDLTQVSVTWHDAAGTQLGERIQLDLAVFAAQWADRAYTITKPGGATTGKLRISNGAETFYVTDVCVARDAQGGSVTQYATAVVSQTGVPDAAAATGAPDDVGATLYDFADRLALDLGGMTSRGDRVTVYVQRRDYGDGGGTAHFLLEGRTAAGIWEPVDRIETAPGIWEPVNRLEVSQMVGYAAVTVEIWEPVDQLRVRQKDGSGDDIKVDAAAVTAASRTTRCSAFANGGFESGTDGWWTGGGLVTVNDAFSGSFAGQIQNSNAGGFAVAVDPGQTYTLALYSKRSGTSGWAGFGVDYMDASNAKIGNTASVTVSGTTYREYGLPEFTVPANATQIWFWAWVSTGERIYLDEVCLTRTDVSGPSGGEGATWTEAANAWGLQVGGDKFAGMSFYDYDRDGLLDLGLNTHNNGIGSRLFRQTAPGVFADVTATQAPALDAGDALERAFVWGDLNNDGYVDFARNQSGNATKVSIEVYLQDPGSGRFGDGLGGTTPLYIGGDGEGNDVDIYDGCNTEGMGFLDFDGDGDLDILFDNHDYGVDVIRNETVDHTTRALTGRTGAARWTHATRQNGANKVLGLDQRATDGDYGAFVDINDDGWVDIFMRKRDENDFFLNEGGTFRNGEDLAQAENGSKGSNAIFDFDNDGDFDVFWTENDLNQLFRNDFGTYTPLGAGGTTGIPTSFSTKINEAAGGDFDNDGDIDLLLVGNDRSFLYVNLINDPVLGVDVGQPMTFRLDDSEGFTNGQRAYGTLFVDIDNDGDLDAFFNRDAETRLWLNGLYDASTPDYTKNTLSVRVWDDRTEYMGADMERPALGATVILTDCNGRVLSGLREVSGGNSRGVQNPHDVHFGLPYGRNFNYVVVVKYPTYVRADGTRIRRVITKSFNPSTFGNTTPLIEFRTRDTDTDCPTILEICDNGLDDDGDGLVDCADPDCEGIEIEHRIAR